MPDWKLHLPTSENLFFQYQCGLVAGQRVALRKDLAILDHKGKPTGRIHPKGAVWQVLPGLTSDPVLWFLDAEGNRCTWDDDKSEVAEWFQPVDAEAGKNVLE